MTRRRGGSRGKAGRSLTDVWRLRRPDPFEDDVLPWFSVDTKKQDPRYRWYREQYGARCWELDALSPVVLRDRVADAIDGVLDHDAWDRAEVVERAERESLQSILSAWPGISRQAQKYDEGRP